MVTARQVIAAPTVCIALVAAISVSCRTSSPKALLVEPGAPGQPTREISTKEAVDLHAVRATTADVQFMQGMIGHHQQAIEMAELLATHTSDDTMRKLGPDRDLPDRRNPHDAAVAHRSPSGRAGRTVDADARAPADAGPADPRGDGSPRGRQRDGVRSTLSPRDDQATRRRVDDGGGSLPPGGRGPGSRYLHVRVLRRRGPAR